MAENTTILEGYSDVEKGAYLGAIASLATADRQASEEELEYIDALCRSANLSPQQQASVQQAATSLSADELQQCLGILKNSELKYSLIADLMAFAKADNDYSEAEEQSIQKISDFLGLNQQQLSALDQFSKQTVEPAAPAEPTQQNFFGGAVKEKLQGAGINSGSLMKGVLAIAAPMLISRLLSGRMGGRGGRMGGGGLGGMLGGGMGGMFGGGGLGSLIGMLSGGRGMRNTGGLLGQIFGRRGF